MDKSAQMTSKAELVAHRIELITVYLKMANDLSLMAFDRKDMQEKICYRELSNEMYNRATKLYPKLKLNSLGKGLDRIYEDFKREHPIL